LFLAFQFPLVPSSYLISGSHRKNFHPQSDLLSSLARQSPSLSVSSVSILLCLRSPLRLRRDQRDLSPPLSPSLCFQCFPLFNNSPSDPYFDKSLQVSSPLLSLWFKYNEK
ncbi:hypothetical protein TorRG33x02_227500, partial [Trema orientale]